MFERIRAEQQAVQVSEIRKIPVVPAAVTYQGRDASSGMRMLVTPDGGEVRAKYLSYTSPVSVPLYVDGGRLQSGYMVSR